MIPYEIWVRPEEYQGEDKVLGPTPEDAGLRGGVAYRVLDIITGTDQDKEAFVSIINDEGEIWFISNRHLRVVQLDIFPNKSEGSIPWTHPVDAFY